MYAHYEPIKLEGDGIAPHERYKLYLYREANGVSKQRAARRWWGAVGGGEVGAACSLSRAPSAACMQLSKQAACSTKRALGLPMQPNSPHATPNGPMQHHTPLMQECPRRATRCCSYPATRDPTSRCDRSPLRPHESGSGARAGAVRRRHRLLGRIWTGERAVAGAERRCFAGWVSSFRLSAKAFCFHCNQSTPIHTQRNRTKPHPTTPIPNPTRIGM